MSTVVRGCPGAIHGELLSMTWRLCRWVGMRTIRLPTDVLIVAGNGTFRLMSRIRAERRRGFRAFLKRGGWEVTEIRLSTSIPEPELPRPTRALAAASA